MKAPTRIGRWAVAVLRIAALLAATVALGFSVAAMIITFADYIR